MYKEHTVFVDFHVSFLKSYTNNLSRLSCRYTYSFRKTGKKFISCQGCCHADIMQDLCTACSQFWQVWNAARNAQVAASLLQACCLQSSSRYQDAFASLAPAWSGFWIQVGNRQMPSWLPTYPHVRTAKSCWPKFCPRMTSIRSLIYFLMRI